MEWGNISEPIAKLANVLLADPEWSPNKLHSPIQQDVPDNILLPDDLLFTPALPMAINPATPNSGIYEVYINSMSLCGQPLVATTSKSGNTACHTCGGATKLGRGTHPA